VFDKKTHYRQSKHIKGRALSSPIAVSPSLLGRNVFAVRTSTIRFRKSAQHKKLSRTLGRSGEARTVGSNRTKQSLHCW